MSWVLGLPTVNAALNGISAVLLLLGWRAIRTGRTRLHRILMLSAFAVSTLFLTSYLVYHFSAVSPRFPGAGWARRAYLAMLVSHVVLAAALLPLVLWTLRRALRGQFEAHRRLARWTFPIWLYVSVTGVAVYIVLYVVYGATPTLRGNAQQAAMAVPCGNYNVVSWGAGPAIHGFAGAGKTAGFPLSRK